MTDSYLHHTCSALSACASSTGSAQADSLGSGHPSQEPLISWLAPVKHLNTEMKREWRSKQRKWRSELIEWRSRDANAGVTSGSSTPNNHSGFGRTLGALPGPTDVRGQRSAGRWSRWSGVRMEECKCLCYCYRVKCDLMCKTLWLTADSDQENQ